LGEDPSLGSVLRPLLIRWSSRWHFDIKPENILFCGDDSSEESNDNSWKIADPGLARFVRTDLVKRDQDNHPVANMKGATGTYGWYTQTARLPSLC